MKKHLAVSSSILPLCLIGMAAPVCAHHSAAGYDLSKTLSAQATVKEFRWTAPHSAAAFTIKGADGKPQDVTMAGGAPAAFMRQGFKPRDFKAGDKVEITWHPSKSGNIGGTLSTMKMPDGRVFKDVEFGPGSAGVTDATKQAETAEPK